MNQDNAQHLPAAVAGGDPATAGNNVGRGGRQSMNMEP
jgi:hypothetical protein